MSPTYSSSLFTIMPLCFSKPKIYSFPYTPTVLVSSHVPLAEKPFLFTSNTCPFFQVQLRNFLQ